MADDRFWASMAERLLGTNTKVALLESWSATASRWHLIGADTRLETVRALLKPGALLTVYPDAPQAPDDTLATHAHQLLMPDADTSRTTPNPDNEILGLIQEPEIGTLRFARLRTAAEVTRWLSQAQRALTCGLYPSNPAGRANTLQAIVPQAQPVPQPQEPIDEIAPTRRRRRRTVFGLLIVLTVVALFGLVLRLPFALFDYRPPSLDSLETRAGCTDRTSDSNLISAVDSGSCQIGGTTVILAIFRNDSDRSTWITALRLIGGQNFGVGPGWAIEADDASTAAQVAAALGGRVI